VLGSSLFRLDKELLLLALLCSLRHVVFQLFSTGCTCREDVVLIQLEHGNTLIVRRNHVHIIELILKLDEITGRQVVRPGRRVARMVLLSLVLMLHLVLHDVRQVVAVFLPVGVVDSG
jgi:hypothetical protein